MPGAEDAPPAYFGCVAGAPRSDSDLDRVVEQHQVDGGLERRGRLVVLRVEERVVLDRDPADATVALDEDRAEVDVARRAGRRRCAQRLGPRLRHRVHEVQAASRVGEHLGDEHALVDLEARLLASGAARARASISARVGTRPG